MAVDQPLVVYPKDKKANHSKRKMDEVYDQWEKVKKERGKLTGTKISLNDYFNNKIK